MDEFLKLMLLAYFKQNTSYSFIELAKMYGISTEKVCSLIENLLSEEKIKYVDCLLRLTLKGRLFLQNNVEDFYNSSDQEFTIPKVKIEEAWPIERIYVPEKFLTKI